MSHGIEIAADGRATAAYFEGAAWHKLGVVTTEKLSATDSLKVANISDLDYRLEPLYAMTTAGMVDTGKLTTVRNAPFTGETDVVGGYHSPDFALETPEMWAEFIDTLVDEGAHMNAIALINEGRQMFVSLWLTDVFLGGSDRNSLHLLCSTGFDGSLANTVKEVNFRVECANMHRIALAEKSEYTFKARHTSAVMPRIDEARKVLQMGWKSVEAFQKEAEAMLDKEITDAEFTALIRDFIPMPKEPSLRVENKVEASWGKISHNYYNGNEQSINDTAWGAYNAITDFLDNQSGNKMEADARMIRSFADVKVLSDKDRALSLVKKTFALV